VFKQQGIEPNVHLLRVDMQHHPPERVRTNLGLSPTDSVVLIKRQHFAEAIPVVCACVYVAGRYRKYLDGGDFRRHSVYELLEQSGTVKIAVARQEISAIAADKELARILDVRPGSPLLLMENVTLTDQDIPIDNTFFYCRPDRFKFMTTVRRTQTHAALSAIPSDQRR
jgi:GntR family transcriptional regulator